MLYRTESFTKSTSVIEEMRAICRFLYEWRRYKPIVAGGALWAWAANKHCRDADVFMRKRMFLERKIKKYFDTNVEVIELAGINTVQGYYGKSQEQALIPFDLYKILLAPEKIAVDVILTGNHPANTVKRNFDYEHCKVGFGKSNYIALGVDAYSRGELISDYNGARVRDKETILSKVQPDLWGKDIAKVRLLDTIKSLMDLYNEVENEAQR